MAVQSSPVLFYLRLLGQVIEDTLLQCFLQVRAAICKSVVHPYPMTPFRHPAGVPQHREVPGDGGLGHAQHLYQVADTPFPFTEKGKNPESCGLSQCLA
jgi:hypothetical protein